MADSIPTNTVVVKEADEAKVNSPCLAYTAMSAKWPKHDALMSGSEAMRLLKEAVLPKGDVEEDASYNFRLSLGSVYGSYKKTVQKISGKPFTKNVTIMGEISEPLNRIRDDVDNSKTMIEEFGREVLETAVNYGLTHILVEYPRVMKEDGTTPNLQQERTTGIKPYFVHVSPKNLISWTMNKDDGELEEIRIKEETVVKNGRWGEKIQHQVRVINRTGFEIYVQGENEEYTLFESGTHTFGKVPLVTIYLNKTGELTGESCLSMLAEAEVEYFQCWTDQKHGLYYGRYPFLAGTGLDGETVKEPIVQGAKGLLRTTSPDAKYYFVTHDGEIFRVGQEQIQFIIARMEALGMEPMVQKSGSVTATGKAIDQSNYDSDMQSWVRLLENGFEEAYQIASEIVSVELPEDFRVDIFNEFSITLKSLEYTKYLITSCQGGLISKETLWEQLKRYGILPENHTADLEKERLEAQGPELGTLGLGMDVNNEDDDG